MGGSGGPSAKSDCMTIDFALLDMDIERICQGCSETENPPQIFFLSGRSLTNSLLVASVEFLEEGQLLACPGLPLAGAAFDPGWGFARAEVEIHLDGTAEFRLPFGRFETSGDRDAWGYRMCPIDNREIPHAIRELSRIRAEIAKPRKQGFEGTGAMVTLAKL
jgi:hypothetical protein